MGKLSRVAAGPDFRMTNAENKMVDLAAGLTPAGGAGSGPGPSSSNCEASAPPPRRVTLRSELQLANGLRNLFGAAVFDGVSGVPDPADGRQTILSLTDDCRNWIAEKRTARQDWLTRTLQARLSPAEQDRLMEAVELLGRLLDD